ncbi:MULTISPECIES: TIR domain-containing protein [unclassified Neorhizobium]|uniref:TIR domain-containing protein n=1 Tax=unclassified Neorhizobium TaxID=2629175 RepID=UPI001FF60C0D|nr:MULTISPECIES: nucleotide-binding protein [unclassified Neorhizobium]MCJ9668535.1 nucleotide-binding protein [Neorhizobium sp. SHOUNA12B]MCJ9744238.1 nucleotide-binding protein [Neorhizobium sp. SHOUNA12A]
MNGASPDLFKQIDHAVLDLQSSQLQTYERPLKTLVRLLASPDLEASNQALTKDLDLEEFLNSQDEQEGMVGSTTLKWPDDPEKIMGITLLLIRRFGENPEWITDFGHTYFYSSSKIISTVHNVTRHMIIPFVRDYKSYVLSHGRTEPRLVKSLTNKIFVVHGHDGEARETVARYLTKIGFDPIILHEQANRGKTVIEKVEANSDVSFAVVLLTPDDEGCVKGGTPEARVRQNVLLELGYFIALLGRANVCALKRGTVEIPSDFAGVLWEAMDDSGGWKAKLARELQAAGHTIDWNRVMT